MLICKSLPKTYILTQLQNDRLAEVGWELNIPTLSWWLCVGLSPVCPCSSCTAGSELDTALKVSSPMLSRGEGSHLFWWYSAWCSQERRHLSSKGTEHYIFLSFLLSYNNCDIGVSVISLILYKVVFKANWKTQFFSTRHKRDFMLRMFILSKGVIRPRTNFDDTVIQIN